MKYIIFCHFSYWKYGGLDLRFAFSRELTRFPSQVTQENMPMSARRWQLSRC